MKSELHQQVDPKLFDDLKTRWYQYALRRLPGSCLISFITLAVAAIVLSFGLAVYRWLAG